MDDTYEKTMLLKYFLNSEPGKAFLDPITCWNDLALMEFIREEAWANGKGMDVWYRLWDWEIHIKDLRPEWRSSSLYTMLFMGIRKLSHR